MVDVAGRTRSGRVIEVLTQLTTRLGAPRALRSDHGPKLARWRDGAGSTRSGSIGCSPTRGYRGGTAPTRASRSRCATNTYAWNGLALA